METENRRFLQVKEMVKVRKIDNPFQPDQAEIKEFDYSRGKSLRDYLNESGFEYADRRVIVTGKAVEDLDVRLDEGDEITVIPEVEAPVVAVVSAIISAVWAYAVAHPFLFAFYVLSMAYSVYQYMNQPKMPDFNLGSSGMDEGSPTYGWDGVQTIQEVGVPVALVYGEHRVGGNIINQFLWEDGDNNYLNVLLALCEGEIEAVEDIEVNSNPINNFDGVSIAKRYGTNNQDLISNFEDLHNIYPVNATLTKNNSYVYTTVDSDVEAFEIHLRCNNGLYQQNSSSGDIQSWSVSYRVEYKLHSEGTYTDLGIATISAKSRSVVRRVYRKAGLTPGQYDIRITRTSDDSSLDPLKQGDLSLFQIDEIKTDDLSYPNTALLGLQLLATDQLSGSMPNITSVVKGKKILVPDVLNAGAPVDWEDYYWAGSDYRLLADDTLLSWNGTTYADKYSANPVWCLRDMIVNNRFGLGEFISTQNLDMASLLEMSRYCEEKVPDGQGGFEKRFRLDVVIDSNNKALDILIQLCATFNAMPVYSGGGISFKIDKPSMPTQLFGMGNIIKDSFAQSWKTLKEVPNVIEVQFTDKDKNYNQETIAYIDEEALASGEPMRKSQVRLFTTRVSYAIRTARYALKVARYINRSVAFKAGIDAVACQAGDIISVSHDVPQWGFSGRIQQNSMPTLIKLDREMVIEDGKSYKIQIRFSDDVIEEKLITSSAGAYTEIECEEFTYVPQAYDVYAIGETNKVKKDFRVVSVQREGKNEVQISALEYNEAVYDDSEITIPENNYSSLSNEVPLVEDLILTESVVKKPDGTIVNAIDVWWTLPQQYSYDLGSYQKAKVYIKETLLQGWILVGETTGDNFSITNNINVGTSYDVAVVSVGRYSERGISESPQETLQVNGKGERPDDVSGFTVGQDGNEILLTWAANSDTDLKGYEIREGEAWDRGVLVTKNIAGTIFRIPVFGYGEKRYMIKAIDTSGNYSLNEQSGVIEITGTISFDNVQEDNLLNFDEGQWQIVSEQNSVLVVTSLDEVVTDSLGNNIEINTYGFEQGRDLLNVVDSSGEQVQAGAEDVMAYSSYVYLNLRDLGGEYASEGIFISDVVDLGSRLRARINVVANVDAINANAVLQISLSDDNVVWSDWAEYNYGEYICRYYRIMLIVTNNDTRFGGKVNALNGYATIQYYEEEWADEIVNQTKAIDYKKDYYSKVSIAAIAHGAKYVRITNKTLNGCTLEVRDDATGSLTTGTVDIKIKGY